MKVKSMMVTLVAAIALTMFSATAANAQYGAAIVTDNNNCLIPDGNRVLRVFPCTYQGARYSIYNGVIKTVDNFCFDHSIPKGVHPSRGDASIRLVRCSGGDSQVWFFILSGRGKGLVQNKVNPEVCMNIEGGNDSQGSRLIVWPCGYNNPARNEKFYVGERVSVTTAVQAGVAQSDISRLLNGGAVAFRNGNRLIGMDGSSLIAAGAGNLVAAGAGNLVAAGAGNLVAAGAGNLVAAGAGNVIGNDSNSLRRFLGQ